MMESCLNSMPDSREQVQVDDLKRDLSSDFSVLLDPQLVQQSREHLQVYLRVRPLTSAESDRGEAQDSVVIEAPHTVLLKPPSCSFTARLSSEKGLPVAGQRFHFSQVYGPDTTQRELFEGTVKDLVKDVLEGGNSLVFTYGVTNTGKTFTFLGPDADAGILPRSLEMIFSSIDERVFTGTSVKPHRCRDFNRLTCEQQADEAAFKRSLFRQIKDAPREKSNASLSTSTQMLLEGSSVSAASGDRISLEVEADTKFSVWVSFCEIYNENIHDLLEALPSGAAKRPALRLSQDVRGNAFVKDLRWVQVNSADEAYKVMKLGKKNQSFSSTKLNQLSSRSHSIFSIRILKIEDLGTPRVHTMSELCLCDLAGSERCAKTQNIGERLKEAGNINTSLLILGKCITALRHNQQAKLLQHVPFRESKLTHYLQSFFCGRGKACMIVNINQCASMYDETLNVLKFSAVAQQVVVLTTKPLPVKPPRSASDVSLLVDNAERKAVRGSRRSSLIGWESSLEDVQEDEADETTMDETMDQSGVEEDGKTALQHQVFLVKELQVQLKRERAENMLMEAKVREEVGREFSNLFSEMQTDFRDRLVRERALLEERAERRLEIFKTLVEKMNTEPPGADVMDSSSSSSSELCGMKKIADAAHKYLSSDRAGAQEDKRDAVEKLLQKILEVNEHQRRLEEQRAQKTTGEGSIVEDEEKTNLLLQLQETTSQLDQLQKHVAELQNSEREQLQLSEALEKEKKARDDALTALEYQTMGKEEALASLEEERKAREETLSSLVELRRSKEEVTAALGEERKTKEEAITALQEERKGREEAVAALEEERRSKEEAIAALEEEKRNRPAGEEKISQEEARPVGERRDISQLVEERERMQQEAETLRQEVRELTNKLRTTESQVTDQSLKAEQASVQLQEAQAQLDEHSKEIQEKSSQILSLNQELHGLREELQTIDQLREEVRDLRRNLAEEKDKNGREGERLLELQEELQREKDNSTQKKLISEQQLEELNLKLDQKTTTETDSELKENLKEKLLESEAQVKSLQKKLQEQHEEQENQAVQEARRKEVERRRELLAVAHEAIAQKDAELLKKEEEISRQKQKADQDSEKVKSLSLDLQRKEEDASDLREKLADYKKQVQQVQKEISTMRGEEKALRQKLCDVEKSKKQLQTDLTNRDRTIQQLKLEQSSSDKSDQTLQLYQKACKDLEVKDSVIENMRLALTEQEETQEEMDKVLEEKLNLVQELESEVEKLRTKFLQQENQRNDSQCPAEHSDDVDLANQRAAQAQEKLKLCVEKHQAERKKWMEEKLSLIGQAKEAEDKRSHELRKFADDRDRYARQQSQLDSLSAQLAEKEQTMERWRKDRDTLVSALEVQLQKLLSSQAEKDKLIQQLQQSPPEGDDGGVRAAELEAALSKKETEILRLKEEMKAAANKQEEMTTQVREQDRDKSLGEESETINRKSGGRRDPRLSVSSRGSSGCPSVLDSSEISTENGRTTRFPRPELEISFSPLQPNRVALRRQGEENAVTVKISRSGRKRKSVEMEKDEVEAENRRNTRTKRTLKMTPHQEEKSSPLGCHDSPGSGRSKKEGTLQKIGEFLQSSPTLLGSKAKKMMGLVSGRGETDVAASSSSSSSSLILRVKKNKRKLFRPDISSPMVMPSHPIISRGPEEKDSDHQIIKRRLRSRMVK